MTDQHPITPPPELVEQWARYQGYETPEVLWRYIATQAARWGADTELEACCEWLDQNTGRWDLLAELRLTRRPKTPSLKEQALSELNLTADFDGAELSRTQVDLICVLLQKNLNTLASLRKTSLPSPPNLRPSNQHHLHA